MKRRNERDWKRLLTLALEACADTLARVDGVVARLGEMARQ